MADPSIREDELALTLDYRCARLAVSSDESYCTNFAAAIEGIIRAVPETTSDVMESVSVARRAYASGLPAPEDPAPREFDESRSHATCYTISPSLPMPTALFLRDVSLRVAAHFQVPAAPPCAKGRSSSSFCAHSSSWTGLRRV